MQVWLKMSVRGRNRCYLWVSSGDGDLEQAWPVLAGHVKGSGCGRIGDAIDHIMEIPSARLGNDGTAIDHTQDITVSDIYFIDAGVELHIDVDPAIGAFKIIDAFQWPSIQVNRQTKNDGKAFVSERQFIRAVAH